MKTIIMIISILFLNSCSLNKKILNVQSHKIVNSESKIVTLDIFRKHCNKKLLCEYLPWFKMTNNEIKNLQKDYGISYSMPTIVIKNELLDNSLLLRNQKFIKKLRTTTMCQDGSIDKIIFDTNALLFSCNFYKDKEFRYTVYFGNIKNNSLKLKVIDTGGGTFE